MRILIIGGGIFLGRALLDASLARGHGVTVFNRGRARKDWPDGVQVLTGDRRGELGALAAGSWDAVIDTCGYNRADVLPTAAALAACPRYLFVSSVSAYASQAEPGLREDAALAGADGLAADAPVTGETYGPLKAECERALAKSLGDRLLVVRPGLIVGPGDRSGRFSYWPWRVAAGGEMLVPDAPASAALQFIDVRDLAEWSVHLLEIGAAGCFNALGPAGGEPIGWPELIAACQRVVRASGRFPAAPVRVSEALLQSQGINPWTELPLWLPSTDPEYAGFMSVDIERARVHGLCTRPLEETVAAVLAEAPQTSDDPRLAGKVSLAREAEIIGLAGAA